VASSRDFEIDNDLADFLVSPVAIVVATAGVNHRPHAVRGYAARVSDDGTRVSVYVPTQQSGDVRADIEENANIAVVFSRVRDFKTYQLKGGDAELGSPAAGDAPRLTAYCEAFYSELERVGLSRESCRGFSFAEFTELRFTPTSCFAQTPGPNAGKPIGSRT
jgi:hypothetical protein